MSETAIWSLVGIVGSVVVTLVCALIIKAFNMSLTLAELKHSLKLRDEEFKRFFSEIESIKKIAKDTVLSIQEKHDISLKKVTERYIQEIEKLKQNMDQIEHNEKTSKVVYTPFLLVKRPKKP